MISAGYSRLRVHLVGLLSADQNDMMSGAS
jgi:hypothetical protein